MPEAIIDMVRAGFGVSVLSRWAVEPELRDGTLIARPLTPEGLWLRSWLVTRPGLPADAPARRFAALSAQWSQESDDGRGTVAFQGSG
jgi:LysR family transcriptional regulator for metE and metH